MLRARLGRRDSRRIMRRQNISDGIGARRIVASGGYVLTVSITGGVRISFCVSNGGPPPGQPGAGLPTNVQLEHTGNTVTIQPEDASATFRMDLQSAVRRVSSYGVNTLRSYFFFTSGLVG